MGGKKRGAPRQKQRAKLIAEEHVLSTTKAGKVIESQADESLFVIDNVGDKKLSKMLINQAMNEKKKKKKEKGMPKQLGFKVKKIMKTHENNLPQIQSMAKQAKEKRNVTTLKRQQRKIKRTNFDLWGDEGNDNDGDNKNDTHILSIDPTYNPNIHKKKSIKVVPITEGTSSSMGGTAPITFRSQTKAQLQNPTTQNFGAKARSTKQKKKREHEKRMARPSVAIDVALPGQSYLPDQEQHQDVIGEALTIEIRRKEAEEDKKAPIGGVGGLSEETLAVLTHDPFNNDSSSSDDEDDDEDDDEEMEDVTFLPQKHPGKLTTAKRNKQKRARQQKSESKARKKQKQLLHSITEVKKIHKELNVQEHDRLEKKVVIDELKKEEKAKPLGTQLYTKRVGVDPLNVPALPVALTDEIRRGKFLEMDEHGNPVTSSTTGLYSLRTVKPKGSLLKERLESLADRKMANRKKLRKKRVIQGKRRKAGKIVDIVV